MLFFGLGSVRFLWYSSYRLYGRIGYTEARLKGPLFCPMKIDHTILISRLQPFIADADWHQQKIVLSSLASKKRPNREIEPKIG